ncbi:MAG: hypothetical protein R3B54_04575 [Bdellovibrionota bacterium]
MMLRVLLFFSFFAGPLCAAGNLDLVPHFGGGSVYLKKGDHWYVGASVWKLKRDPSLDEFKYIRSGAEPCGVTHENEVVCAQRDGSLSNRRERRSLGKVPAETKRYLGYCLETTSGEIYCLQSFVDGSDLRYRYELVDTRALGPIEKISASATHVCVQTLTGGIHCWGENYGGKLGTGGFPFYQRPEEGGDWSVGQASPGVPFPTRPVADGTLRFTDVSVYSSTSCALSEESRSNLYCWGRLLDTSNLFMDFASFSQTTSSVPRQVNLQAVPSGHLEGLAVGPLVGFAYDESGRLYVWGDYGGPLRFPERLDLKVRLLARVPNGFSIDALVPLQGEVCVLGAFADREQQILCTRRSWDHPADPPVLVPVELEE